LHNGAKWRTVLPLGCLWGAVPPARAGIQESLIILPRWTVAPHRTVILALQAVALLVVLAAGALAIAGVAQQQDRIAAAEEGEGLKAAVEAYGHAMARALLTTVAEADLGFDDANGRAAGLHARISAPLANGFGLEYVFLATADGTVLYASERGQLGARSKADELQPALRRMALRLHASDDGTSDAPLIGVAEDGGEAILIIAHVLRAPAGRSAPLIAFVADVLDARLLGELAGPLRLDGLKLASMPGPPGTTTLELPNLLDGPQVAFTWQASQPATRLMSLALPWLLGVACALCLLFLLLLMRERRLAGQLRDSVDEARDLANRDTLTGLASRAHFLGRLDQALRSPLPGRRLAVMFVDLDGFKAVNDTNGHPVGDALLQVIAGRLRDCVSEQGVVARIGGDEFVLFADFQDDDEFRRLVARLNKVISKPVTLDGQELRVGASMGSAQAPVDGTTAAELMRLADIALYSAKADGGGVFRAFEQALELEHMQRRRVEQELLRALDCDELTVLYQPQMDVETEQVVGFEALVRWDHPTRGRILPGAFVPVAERSRLITRLDAYVLRRVLTEAKALSRVTLAVNLSPLNLRTPGFADEVLATLEETGFDPSHLEFELTESAIIDAGPDATGALRRLREKGVRFALDDFGTGHASLVHIRSFPITKIKIDRTFIAALGVQHDAAAIVEYVVRLGRSLGVIVTAEGVETRSQLRFVRVFGAHQAQGFLFSPPVSLEAAAAMLSRCSTPDAAGRASPGSAHPADAATETPDA